MSRNPSQQTDSNLSLSGVKAHFSHFYAFYLLDTFYYLSQLRKGAGSWFKNPEHLC